MLLGQVADALATPFAGRESDKSADLCGRYGKRKGIVQLYWLAKNVDLHEHYYTTFLAQINTAKRSCTSPLFTLQE